MPTTRVALESGRLRHRRDRIADAIDAWGDLEVLDVGAATDVRMLEFRLLAPGTSLPVEVEAIYREYYRRTNRDRWSLAKYTYEYLDRVRGHRLAYHLHVVGEGQAVPHAHCETLATMSTEDRHHLRAVEIELREAHEEFMRLYAAGVPPDCAAFRPLALPLDPDHR